MAELFGQCSCTTWAGAQTQFVFKLAAVAKKIEEQLHEKECLGESRAVERDLCG